MARKEQICVRLNPEDLKELEKLSKQHDLSKGWFIQKAVKQFIDQVKAREGR